VDRLKTDVRMLEGLPFTHQENRTGFARRPSPEFAECLGINRRVRLSQSLPLGWSWRDESSSLNGYLWKGDLWPNRKLPLIVSRRGDDGGYADRDRHNPQPPRSMQQRTDRDERESRPGSNVAADHSLQMSVPPEHFLRWRMREAPHGFARNAHPNGSVDNRRDAQVLHEFRPHCPQNSER
jgi:hypothetical protein